MAASCLSLNEGTEAPEGPKGHLLSINAQNTLSLLGKKQVKIPL
jgi:hypothetical protein